MQTLVTMINALLESNEAFILFFYLLLSFVEAFSISLLFTNVFSIETNTKQKLIYGVIFAFISTIFIYIIPIPHRIIFNTVAISRYPSAENESPIPRKIPLRIL